MAVIPVVHADAGVRTALRRGMPRRGVRVVNCRSVDHVELLLRRELVDAVVIDVLAGWADATFELTPRYPRIPFFAHSAFRPDDGVLVAACRRAGLGVFVDGVDRHAAGEVVDARRASRVRIAALGDVPKLMRLDEPIQVRAWQEIFLRAGSRTTTTDLARTLRRSREYLSREFGAGGAPNLKRVIDLVRTVCAADLLANPGYSVDQVARVLRYSSASHFAGTTRRIAGCTPAELAKLGPRGVLLRFLKGRTRSRI